MSASKTLYDSGLENAASSAGAPASGSTAEASHAHASMSHPKYRPDIDGLRAVAVLSVVGFHAAPNWMRGGFIGVDIFFVISGFLISTILFNSLQNGTFSFTSFYARRVKRIFPALIVVLVACLAYGWFFFLQDEYRGLGKHVAAGAGFVSNLLLWSETGYFDLSAEFKPMLHLWSLGIEEQFYIVWPVLLWVGWKLRWNLLVVTLAVAIGSFAWNIYLTPQDATAGFYSPLTRFWELLAGAALAYITLNSPQTLKLVTLPNKDVQSVLGLGLLGLGFVFITNEVMFPGWAALVPVVGAFLIISAGPNAICNRYILSNPVAVWFGAISFPLYLWHWPLLVFGRIEGAGLLELQHRLLLVALAILLAWLTVVLVEKRLRFAKSNKVTFALVGAMGALLAGGLWLNAVGGMEGVGVRKKGTQEFAKYYDNTFPEWPYKTRINWFEKYRVDCDFLNMKEERAGRYTRVPVPAISASCFTRDPAKPHAVMIWGDSHAQQYNYGFAQSLPQDWQVMQVASSGCRPAMDVTGDPKTDYCVRSNQFAMETVEKARPDVVFLAQLDRYDPVMLSKMAARFKELGVKRVIVAGPVPHWQAALPTIIVRKHWDNPAVRTFDGIDMRSIDENNSLKTAFAGNPDIAFANVIDMMCDKDGCLTQLGEDRLTGVTAYDFAHLTPIASEFVGRQIAPLITGAIQQNGPDQ